jgi:hypothetical protein
MATISTLDRPLYSLRRSCATPGSADSGDTRIRKRPRERQAFLESGVRAFCLTHAGNYNRWETVRLLAHRWPDIEQTATSEAGPYICSVTWTGVRRLFIPDA